MTRNNESNSTLHIGGCNAIDLVNEYGSPLYVYDQTNIEKQITTFKTNFKSKQFKAKVAYASKALLNKAIIELIDDHELYMDSVSAGELFVIHQSGFDMAKVLFHGNNKSKEELKMALNLKVGLIVIDNISELEDLIDLMKDYDQDVHTLLRVNPGIEAHTHEYIVTAKLTSKFGESIYDDKQIDQIIKLYKQHDQIHLDGFHCHIGSQVFGKTPFLKTIEVMSEFVKEVETRHLIRCKTLNIGGGFGIEYTKHDTPEVLNELLQEIVVSAETTFKKLNLSIDTLFIEPGRSIVGKAGTTLYTVGHIKHTYGNKSYVFVDGGMSDNIRPALYQAAYSCDIANKMNDVKDTTYTVAGKLCESGDVVVQDALLPDVVKGDILAVYSTGAYGYSMSSNYNKMLRPAIVFVKNGTSKLVVKRESYTDLVRHDLSVR